MDQVITVGWYTIRALLEGKTVNAGLVTLIPASALTEDNDWALAVNAHDDLVRQLQRSTVQMRIWVSSNGDMIGALGEHIEANEEALRKAGA